MSRVNWKKEYEYLLEKSNNTATIDYKKLCLRLEKDIRKAKKKAKRK